MEKLVPTLLLSLSLILTSLTASAKIEDFNSLIAETQKSEVELRAKLQKEAGINLKGSKPGTIARESIETPKAVEQVASTSQLVFTHKQKPLQVSEKIEMKRVSQELKELND